MRGEAVEREKLKLFNLWSRFPWKEEKQEVQATEDFASSCGRGKEILRGEGGKPFRTMMVVKSTKAFYRA